MTLSVVNLSVMRSGSTLLHPTTLSISSRERIGLVATSGSGKTTLGHALVDELQTQGKTAAHVPQSPDEALDPLRSLAFHWNEAEGALGIKMPEESRTQLFQALKIHQGDLKSRPWGWSRGMQQRFVIAMALIGQPDLLVLDEPTSALDPVVAADTMNLLSKLLDKSHTAMLLITHDMGVAAKHVDRLMVMEDGKIIEDRTTADALNNPLTRTTAQLVKNRSWLSINPPKANAEC